MNIEQYFNDPHPPNKKRIAIIKSMIPKDVKSILDVGVGGGYIMKALKDYDCIGIDNSQEMLNRSDIKVRLADAENLPFLDKQFDLVLATDLIEHLKNIDKGIAEMKRVAKKYILINSPYNECIEWNVKKGRNIYGHKWSITKKFLDKHFPNSQRLFFGSRPFRPYPLVWILRQILQWKKIRKIPLGILWLLNKIEFLKSPDEIYLLWKEKERSV